MRQLPVFVRWHRHEWRPATILDFNIKIIYKKKFFYFSFILILNKKQETAEMRSPNCKLQTYVQTYIHTSVCHAMPCVCKFKFISFQFFTLAMQKCICITCFLDSISFDLLQKEKKRFCDFSFVYIIVMKMKIKEVSAGWWKVSTPKTYQICLTSN